MVLEANYVMKYIILTTLLMISVSYSQPDEASEYRNSLRSTEEPTVDSTGAKRHSPVSYMGIITAGVLADATVNGQSETIGNVRTMQGIRVSDFVFVGLGVGYERFFGSYDPLSGTSIIPVFLHLRAPMVKIPIFPVLFVSAGLSTISGGKLSDRTSISSGGLLVDVGGAITFHLSKSQSLFVDIAYEYQEATEKRWYTSFIQIGNGYYGERYSAEVPVSYNMVNASLGVSF